MKYIRTKDGIYEVIEECFKPMENNMVLIPREGLTKILKQADSIEELCDDFVVIVPTEKPDFVVDFSKNKQTFVKAKLDVFGAIWTEWGLKYVAKMNEKGELELI